MENKNKQYAIIHFEGKKPLKRTYNSCVKAFWDYEHMGCSFVELFNANGIRLSSYPNK